MKFVETDLCLAVRCSIQFDILERVDAELAGAEPSRGRTQCLP